MQCPTRRNFITSETKAQQSHQTDGSSAIHFKWKHVNQEIWDFYKAEL